MLDNWEIRKLQKVNVEKVNEYLNEFYERSSRKERKRIKFKYWFISNVL